MDVVACAECLTLEYPRGFGGLPVPKGRGVSVCVVKVPSDAAEERPIRLENMKKTSQCYVGGQAARPRGAYDRKRKSS